MPARKAHTDLGMLRLASKWVGSHAKQDRSRRRRVGVIAPSNAARIEVNGGVLGRFVGNYGTNAWLALHGQTPLFDLRAGWRRRSGSVCKTYWTGRILAALRTPQKVNSICCQMFWQPLRQAGLRAHEWKQRSRFCSLAGFRCIAFPGRSHASMTLRCDPVTGYSQWEVAVMHFYSFTVAGAAGALRRIDPPRTPFPFNPSAKPSGHLLLCCILTKHDARPVSIFPVGKRPKAQHKIKPGGGVT